MSIFEIWFKIKDSFRIVGEHQKYLRFRLKRIVEIDRQISDLARERLAEKISQSEYDRRLKKLENEKKKLKKGE